MASGIFSKAAASPPAAGMDLITAGPMEPASDNKTRSHCGAAVSSQTRGSWTSGWREKLLGGGRDEGRPGTEKSPATCEWPLARSCWEGRGTERAPAGDEVWRLRPGCALRPPSSVPGSAQPRPRSPQLKQKSLRTEIRSPPTGCFS